MNLKKEEEKKGKQMTICNAICFAVVDFVVVGSGGCFSIHGNRHGKTKQTKPEASGSMEFKNFGVALL